MVTKQTVKDMIKHISDLKSTEIFKLDKFYQWKSADDAGKIKIESEWTEWVKPWGVCEEFFKIQDKYTSCVSDIVDSICYSFIMMNGVSDSTKQFCRELRNKGNWRQYECQDNPVGVIYRLIIDYRANMCKDSVANE